MVLIKLITFPAIIKLSLLIRVPTDYAELSLLIRVPTDYAELSLLIRVYTNLIIHGAMSISPKAIVRHGYVLTQSRREE